MALHKAGRPGGVLTGTANLIKFDNRSARGCALGMGVGRTRQHYTLKASVMPRVCNLIQPLEVDPIEDFHTWMFTMTLFSNGEHLETRQVMVR